MKNRCPGMDPYIHISVSTNMTGRGSRISRTQASHPEGPVFDSSLSQTNYLENRYLSLRSLVPGIDGIGQGLASMVP